MLRVLCDLGFWLWFVVFPLIGGLIRWKWSVAVARKEEVRRLLALASEEAARAELEASLGYGYGYGYGGGDGGGGSSVRVGGSSHAVAPAGMSNCCVVCFERTKNRCSRCKAVQYCSGKCQIIHWRQGHKDECRPPRQLSGDDVDNVESEGKQCNNQGWRNSRKEAESNDSGHSDHFSSDKFFEDESDSSDFSFSELDGSEGKNPSSLPDRLKIGFSAEVMEQRKALPSMTTVVRSADNSHASGEHLGGLEHRGLTNGPSEGRIVNKLASTSHSRNESFNLTVTQNHARCDFVKSKQSSACNGVMSKSNSSPRSLFDFPRDLSPKLHGSKGHFPYELFIKLYNYDKVELYPRGLMNCGNSCYANAVLQCLAFTPPLTAYFLQGLHSKACDRTRWCFTCELERLILKSRERGSPLSPIGVLSQVQRIGSGLSNGREEDAHEFLRCAVDSMQSNCLNEAGMHPTNARGSKLSPFDEETNLIGLTFGGYIRSKIRCMRCRGKSQHDERIMDLALEIDGEIETIEEALKQFTSTEYLDGENKYQCGRCKSYEKAKKKLIILEAPNILSITLKRYRSGNFGKLNKSIKFPEILNLAPYMGEATDKSPIYRLYGVVVHLDSMNSTFSGHYMCYIQNVQRKWFAVDDSSVQPIEQERVLRRGAYMLFYSRCSPSPPRSIRDNLICQEVVTKAELGDLSRDGSRIIPSIPGDHSSQSSFDYVDPYSDKSRVSKRPQNLAELDSSSDSSSIFSHSDGASSTSTDSYHDSSSVDDLAEALFGDGQYTESSGCRNVFDSDTSSSPSTSSSPLYPRRSPLSNSKRYASGHPNTDHDIVYAGVYSKNEVDPPATALPENWGSNFSAKRGGDASFLRSSSSSSKPALEFVYSNSCRDTDSKRLGLSKSSANVNPSTYIRRSSSRRGD